jgi:oligopeptide/dipeptide ABC transporter ATP-binding protein
MTTPLLHVNNLTIDFDTPTGPMRIVDGVSLDLHPGETLGLVGESGCGKTLTSLALMGLVPPPGRVTQGSVRFDGLELVGASERALRPLRGKAISMIFQDPAAALNPVRTVGRQLLDVLERHARPGRRQARARAVAMLERVGVPDAELRMRAYPHELSGGLCQRVLIAMALIGRPRLLIADEPTAALDVTTQAQILTEIRELTADIGTAVLLISHDLGVVAEVCDRVAVMYCGRIVELAPTEALFRRPRHRYTEGLLASMPKLDRIKAGPLGAIAGAVPEPGDWPRGCRFAPRCPHADARCRQECPALRPLGEGEAACFHPAGSSARASTS